MSSITSLTLRIPIYHFVIQDEAVSRTFDGLVVCPYHIYFVYVESYLFIKTGPVVSGMVSSTCFMFIGQIQHKIMFLQVWNGWPLKQKHPHLCNQHLKQRLN